MGRLVEFAAGGSGHPDFTAGHAGLSSLPESSGYSSRELSSDRLRMLLTFDPSNRTSQFSLEAT